MMNYGRKMKVIFNCVEPHSLSSNLSWESHTFEMCQTHASDLTEREILRFCNHMKRGDSPFREVKGKKKKKAEITCGTSQNMQSNFKFNEG